MFVWRRILTLAKNNSLSKPQVMLNPDPRTRDYLINIISLTTCAAHMRGAQRHVSNVRYRMSDFKEWRDMAGNLSFSVKHRYGNAVIGREKL